MLRCVRSYSNILRLRLDSGSPERGARGQVPLLPFSKGGKRIRNALFQKWLSFTRLNKIQGKSNDSYRKT